MTRSPVWQVSGDFPRNYTFYSCESFGDPKRAAQPGRGRCRSYGGYSAADGSSSQHAPELSPALRFIQIELGCQWNAHAPCRSDSDVCELGGPRFGAEDIGDFVQRLKKSFGDKTQLLSNTIGFWVPGELAAKGFDPAAVDIPGLTTGFPEGVDAYPADSPAIPE